jgi:hypothetical protein
MRIYKTYDARVEDKKQIREEINAAMPAFLAEKEIIVLPPQEVDPRYNPLKPDYLDQAAQGLLIRSSHTAYFRNLV